jgi:hypothetical protein
VVGKDNILMRVIILLFTLFGVSLLHAQDNETFAIDSSTQLNSHEVELLNTLLKDYRDTFDFKDKKIAFVQGSGGCTFTDKSHFFESIKPWLDAGDIPTVSMWKLTEPEKEISGGYDVIVGSWVKAFTRKKRTLKQLKMPNEGKASIVNSVVLGYAAYR